MWKKVPQEHNGETWDILVHQDAFKVDCQFECINCSYQWLGSRIRDETGCPKCGHQYYRWINYEDLKNKKFA